MTVAAGIGLRAPHHAEVLEARPQVGFFEVHSENFLAPAATAYLEHVRANWPVSLHGVGLSVGSADGIDANHLERIARLAERIDPFLVSEHLSWSAFGGAYLNDLVALPYTDESLVVLAANVQRMQTRLKRPVLIENPSTYLRFATDTLAEAQFLAELARRTGCGLLVDLNNLAVNRFNHGDDIIAWLDAIPPGSVGEIHLAGHAINDADGARIAIDDHGSRVSPGVWHLYGDAIGRFGDVPTLIEWDSEIPDLSVLLAEAARADAIGRVHMDRHVLAG